ncbi:hypothetical protein HYT01_02260 [Candidatus Giovannonibacteria bacterium]|nr:hypothetical protein [Candidatus Giovannonibacteria bacterium]
MQQVLSSIGWGYIFLLFLVSAGFFLGIQKGKYVLKGMIMALYVLALLFPLIPSELLLGAGRAPEEAFLIKGGVLALLWIILSFLLSRKYLVRDDDSVWWEVLLLSALYAGFFTVLLVGTAPAGALNSDLTGVPPDNLKFFSDPYAIWWQVLPILGIILL